jgi:hypothetical protein
MTNLEEAYSRGYDEGYLSGYRCGVEDGWGKGYTAAEKECCKKETSN